MKRIIAMVLAVMLLIFAMISCGKNRGAAPEAESSSSAPESVSEEPLAPTTAQAASHNAKINPANVNIIQFDDPDPGDKIAVITTTEGEIRVRLFGRQTGETVKAFVKLVESGFYNGQKFHTIVNGYKIEGGGTGSVGADQFPSPPEFSLDLWNFRGAVALENNSANFMIIQANQCLNSKEELEERKFPQKVIDKYLEVGGAPHQDWKNTVFGAVISGMEIVDKIAMLPVDDKGKPVEAVIITTVTIETAE